MMKYDALQVFEAELHPYAPVAERRGMFVDIYVKLKPLGADWPADLSEPGALVICRPDGEPIDYVVLDGGCDCEYRFTESEKEQLRRYVERERLANLAP